MPTYTSSPNQATGESRRAPSVQPGYDLWRVAGTSPRPDWLDEKQRHPQALGRPAEPLSYEEPSYRPEAQDG